ncbi:hypothetical protein D1818_16545 [Aquimarina sp. BL5]|uniref:phage baseplate protein n=1 Tax=Aquimarina sp. BL5 TaxID=1714860 RepID=UPI000E48D01B|nr:hypothetical protein [Aquimarina sp. BL5]AXT52370.1 hypothetical protein D1818_16545 [Aquimarina sp. BL5]RKN10284.1 hypothetical protein D7036_02925 [Aquimarina sp. BL5]
MEINKKNRTELKEYFKINDKPTQEEFADFIEAGLNQAEDGIAKVQGNPLSIQAEGEAVGTQEVLDIYEDLSNDNPQWSFNLNPRVNPVEPTSNQPGFNIKDATGQSRLFIKSGEGAVGIGTIEPTAPLTIKGTHAAKPNNAMQIAENSIQFGGVNSNETIDSAKIEVTENTFAIYGKTANKDVATRKLDIIADGGVRIDGPLSVEGEITTKNLKADNISSNLDLDKEGASHERIPTQMAVKTYVDTRMPKGVIVMWSGNINNIPAGWTLCNGTQGTPNLSGRFIVGFHQSTEDYNTIGNTGGLNKVTLNTSQIPAHSHSGTTNNDGSHKHLIDNKFSGNTSGSGKNSLVVDGESGATIDHFTRTDGSHKHTFTTNQIGGNQPHENRPPYFVLAYIMKL